MKVIVAVNRNWAIGKGGKLLYSLPEDLKFFKETTLNKIVVMGRKTLQSLPNQQPLKDRHNIVVSRNNIANDDVTVVHSISELLDLDIDFDNVFVIGGASIYEELLPYCDTVYLTMVYDDADGDVYFPNISTMPNWVITSNSDLKSEKGYTYRFRTYTNTNVKQWSTTHNER